MLATDLPLLSIELERLTELPDGRLAEWDVLGTGEEPLVWVEGGPGLPAHLARADVALVLDRFRCHLVNAPGSGRSSAPADESGYGLEAVVGFFEAWRQAVGLGPLTLTGHSWGGLVAAAWAALHPRAVRRLIVIDGYAGAGATNEHEVAAESERALDRIRDREWFADAWAAGEHAWGRIGMTEAEIVRGFRAILPFYFAEPEHPACVSHIDRIRRELRWNVPANDAWTGWREEMDYRPLLRTVRCPTLILVGEHDWICGPVSNRALSEAIASSRLIEFSGVGHFPQYEAPEAVRAAIDLWLADIGRRGGEPASVRPSHGISER